MFVVASMAIMVQFELIKHAPCSSVRFSKHKGKGQQCTDYHNITIGGARGVVVIAVGNEHSDMSSNPGRD